MLTLLTDKELFVLALMSHSPMENIEDETDKLDVEAFKSAVMNLYSGPLSEENSSELDGKFRAKEFLFAICNMGSDIKIPEQEAFEKLMRKITNDLTYFNQSEFIEYFHTM